MLAFQYTLRETPPVANRALDILLKMFNLAEQWGMQSSVSANPCKLIRRYRVKSRPERFLSPDELPRLGRVLDSVPMERLGPIHAAAVQILILTGCQRNEVLGLTWDDLDFAAGEMRLRDSKTGGRIVPLPLGEGLPMIGKLLGHRRINMTALRASRAGVDPGFHRQGR